MINKNIIKSLILVLGIFFTFYAGGAYAADSTEAKNLVEDIVSKTPVTDIKDSNVDYMHKWLGEIFGQYIFAPWGKNGDPTLVSKAVGFTNILALILGIVIVYYVFIGGSINAAGKGEVMGQNWSGTWMPIRTIMGFGLIMPVSTIGGGAISLVQAFILWLVILGSNAASILWDRLSDELANKTSLTSSNFIVSKAQVGEVAKMMGCAKALIDINDGRGSYVEYTQLINGEEKTRKISGTRQYGINPSLDFKALKASEVFNNQLLKISFGTDGECGSYEFPKYLPEKTNRTYDTSNSFLAFVPNSDYKIKIINRGHQAAKDVLLDTMSKVDDIFKRFPVEVDGEKYGAKNVHLALVKSSKDISALNAEGVGAETSLLAALELAKIDFEKAANYYSSNMMPNIKQKMAQSDPEVINEMKRQMTFGGWAGAGLWFHQIGEYASLEYRVVNKYIEMRTSSYQSNLCEGFSDYIFGLFGSDDCEIIKDDYIAMDNLISYMSADVINSSTEKSISDEVAGSCNGLSLSCMPDPNISSRMSVDAAQGLLNILAETTASSEPIGQGKIPINSPFETVSSIGQSMNTIAEYGIYTSMFVTFISESGAGKLLAYGGTAAAVTGASGGNVVAGGLMSILAGSVWDGVMGVFKTWIIPAVMALGGILVSTGFVLAYVIPFMPITVWALMIIGYLITVIEAVIAAPLAVIMMVTPEGEGISGTRMERTIQLIATAILRPSLMVIGIIASVTVGFVAFQIWNVFFFGAAESVLAGGILDSIAVIIIYTTTALSITKRVISVMHSLPDKILEWFTSGVSRPFGEDSVGNELEGTVSKMNSAGDQIQGNITGSIGRSMGKINDDRKRQVLSKLVKK